jgi:hypothetical protein
MMRRVLCLICVLGFSCLARAQDKSESWGNLSKLYQGEKIQVRAMNKTRVTGRFLSVSDAAISLQEEAGPQTIQRQDIRSVKLMKVKHRWLNSLIVAGAGAGVGFAIGRPFYHRCPNTETFCLDFGDLPGDVGAVVGFVGGATVGALLPIHDTVYRIDSH